MGMSRILRNALSAAAMAAALMSPAAASAQANYPAKAIELMVAFAPGGGVDLFGRTVAKVLTEEKIVNQRIQVFNKPGAGGELGMAEMAGPRRNDNHSLSAFALHVIYTPLTLGTPNSYKTLTPIAKIFSEYQMMVVRTESPIKSLKDVEAALRKDIGSLRFGGASLGNSDHIVVSKFAQLLGGDPTKVTYIAYSGGESNPAILGGHVDVGMGGLDLMDLVKAGKMRVLAISSDKRLGGDFKDIPTFVEQATTSSIRTGAASSGLPACRPRW
jgi:putative tricarboxylic transport membrane protein